MHRVIRWAAAVVAVSVATMLLPGSAADAAVTPNLGGEVCQFWHGGPPPLGSPGAAVRQLQCLLNHAMDPANFPPLPVDGVQGPATGQRVRQFQSCAGLPVDGIVGPNTWNQLQFWALSPTYVC